MKKFTMQEKEIREILKNWNKTGEEYADFMNFLDNNNIEYELQKKYFRVYGKERFGNIKVFINNVCIFDKDDYLNKKVVLSILFSYFEDSK